MGASAGVASSAATGASGFPGSSACGKAGLAEDKAAASISQRQEGKLKNDFIARLSNSIQGQTITNGAEPDTQRVGQGNHCRQ